MRLTNSIRSAYVRSVLNDIPQKAFEDEIKALTEKVIRAKTPENILELYDSITAKPYLKREYVTVSCQDRKFTETFGSVAIVTISDSIPVPESLRYRGSSNYYAGQSYPLEVSLLATTGIEGKLRDLCAEKAESSKSWEEARRTLQGLANSCTTVKALREAAPEFGKYLPTDDGRPADRSVPALRNVVATVRAAGWAPVRPPVPTPASSSS